MPIAPSTWLQDTPVTAGQLNQDMYTYDGSYFAAQGVMFHANRPICHQAYVSASVVGSSVTGTAWVNFGGVIGQGLSIVDTSALFGVGSDYPGASATYRSVGVTAPGSSGTPGSRGGWVLMIHFITNPPFTGSGAAIGAGWWQSQTTGGQAQQQANVGVIQAGNTGHVNCTFAIDLINITNVSPGYSPSILSVDPNATKFTVPVNSSPNTSGQTPRFSQIWCCTNQGTHTVSTTIPPTIPTYTSSTPINANSMNTYIRNSLSLLNYPPCLQVQAPPSNQTVPSATVTKVQFGVNGQLDNYSGWSSSNNQYIVPLSGMYFCHATTMFGDLVDTGQVQTGLTVNGTNFWGPNYGPTGNPNIQTGVSITRALDLHAGDTVSTYAYCTASGGGYLSSSYYSRLVMVFMSQITNTGLTYTPPEVAGNYFTAGTSPGTASGQLVPTFNNKIANDINFLMNKPYLVSYQATAQTSLTPTQWTVCTMDTIKGMVHGTSGDNYGGWDSTNHRYIAQVPGWYLATAEVSISTASTHLTQATWVAGLYVPTSGGITAPTTAQGPPDWYQEMVPVSGGGPTAATACGLYYLLEGESIQPQMQWINPTGTFATSVTAFNSNFSCFWMSE